MDADKYAKRVEQRTLVAREMDKVVQFAKENDIGPVAFSELMVSMAAALCKVSGVSRANFVVMAGGYFDEAFSTEPELKH